jgi:hypothetical protein
VKVSVVIPAYNAADTIAETLESLRGQSSDAWEAIVVDDGSSDATAEIVQGFSGRDARIRLIRQQNAGEAAARNSGIAQAQYEWLLFLDADDWIAPSHLEKLTAALSDDPGLDAVHCGSARVAPDGTLIVEEYQPPAGDMFAVWARRSAFPVHACIVRKSVVDVVGRFDPSFKKSPDWDLWQRVARTGARFGAVREVLAYYRMRPNAASLDAARMLADGLRVLRQGHAPDPRVTGAHPDHAAGLPAEEVPTQAFYLLSWCAGLQLGRGEDARPLLTALSQERFPELHPESVARCIFDAAPLPACAPPAAWEQLWPKIRSQVEEFLRALEAQALAPNLAGRAQGALQRLALQHSPSWQAIAEELRESEEKRKELEDAIEQLGEALRASLVPDSGMEPSPEQDVSDRPQGERWSLNLTNGSRAHWALSPDDPDSIRVAIETTLGRRRWDIQLNLAGLNAVSRARYTVEFRARADSPRGIAVGFAQAHPPWSGLGLYQSIELTPQWQRFRVEFMATADDDTARLHFDLGGNDSAVELTAVAVHQLAPDEPRDSGGATPQ